MLQRKNGFCPSPLMSIVTFHFGFLIKFQITSIFHRWRESKHFQSKFEPNGFQRDSSNLPETSRRQTKLEKKFRNWGWVEYHGSISWVESSIVSVQCGPVLSWHVSSVWHHRISLICHQLLFSHLNLSWNQFKLRHRHTKEQLKNCKIQKMKLKKEFLSCWWD